MEKFSSGTQKNVSEDVIEELFEKDYIRRTIIVQPLQNKELSVLARKVQHFQARMFNIGCGKGTGRTI